QFAERQAAALRLRGQPKVEACAASDWIERFARLARIAHVSGQLVLRRRREHFLDRQSFGRIQSAARLPGCFCSMPQPPAVGSILSGLRLPRGLNASRRFFMAARSVGENILFIKPIFSTPMPCSPVTLPPQARHSSRISLLAARTRLTCSASRSSNSRIG